MAVLVERSPEMVVALLGVLKAGAAWMPLDPDHPAGRLAAILEGSAPALAVTRGALAGSGADRYRYPRWLSKCSLRERPASR